jgi:WD40 repeat protein
LHVGSDLPSIIVWNTLHAVIEQYLIGHSGGIVALKLMENSLVSASRDQTLKRWNYSDGTIISNYEGSS